MALGGRYDKRGGISSSLVLLRPKIYISTRSARLSLSLGVELVLAGPVLRWNSGLGTRAAAGCGCRCSPVGSILLPSVSERCQEREMAVWKDWFGREEG